jgi:aminocarboxymuconate-semialdehyde decarboxylase
MTDYDFGNSIGVPLESTLAVMSVVYSGILDRRPDARIGACHGGGSAAYGIGRLWLRYTQGRDGGHLERPPVEYLGRMFFDCLLHDDLSLDLLVRRVGSSQVMIGTDHPYHGDMPGGSVAWIREAAFLSPEEKDAILSANAARFLGRDFS